MSTFLETLGLFLAGVGLAFWLGRVSRDEEVEQLRESWGKRQDELFDAIGQESLRRDAEIRASNLKTTLDVRNLELREIEKPKAKSRRVAPAKSAKKR